jgi:hypothetical protein
VCRRAQLVERRPDGAPVDEGAGGRHGQHGVGQTGAFRRDRAAHVRLLPEHEVRPPARDDVDHRGRALIPEPPNEAIPQVLELAVHVDGGERPGHGRQAGVRAGGEPLEAVCPDLRGHPGPPDHGDRMTGSPEGVGDGDERLEVTLSAGEGAQEPHGDSLARRQAAWAVSVPAG